MLMFFIHKIDDIEFNSNIFWFHNTSIQSSYMSPEINSKL